MSFYRLTKQPQTLSPGKKKVIANVTSYSRFGFFPNYNLKLNRRRK